MLPMQQQLKFQGTYHTLRLASVDSGIRNGSRSRKRMQVNSAAGSSSSSSNNSSRGGVLVDGLVVQPAYRSTPWEAEQQQARKPKHKALIMFVSESGICRAPLAAALFNSLLQSSPLNDWIEVQTRASRDYCTGQEPHPTAAAVAAAALGTTLTATGAAAAAAVNGDGSSSSGAVQFNPAVDIVAADLVLVMDKHTAADVLREVSSYDLINPGGHYSSRVRLLGSFHPELSQASASQADAQDIDDPLYGNVGGEEEEVAVLRAAKLIFESCTALLQQLEGLAADHRLLPGSENPASSTDGQIVGHSNGQAAATATNNTTSSSSAACAVDQQYSGAVFREPLVNPAASSTDSQTLGQSNGHDDAIAAETSKHPGAVFRELLVQRIREEGVISWLVPPMLQGSNTDLGGWV